MKGKFLLLAIVAIVGLFITSVTKSTDAVEINLSELTLENIEALSQGEITVVGCKLYKGATCYVFDGNGQLVDRKNNQYPG